MGKIEAMLGTAAVVFAGGAVLVVVSNWGRPAWRWVKAKADAVAVAIDGGIERVTGWDGAPIDWDAAALGSASGCPECWGADRAQASQSELALLRTINVAGREETSRLRHQVALLNDAVAAADRRNAELAGHLVEASREVERLLRERSMAPQRRDAALGRTSARAPGAAMGDA